MLAVQVWPLQRASTRGRRGPERRRPQILILCDTDAREACWQAPANLNLPVSLSHRHGSTSGGSPSQVEAIHEVGYPPQCTGLGGLGAVAQCRQGPAKGVR